MWKWAVNDYWSAPDVKSPYSSLDRRTEWVQQSVGSF